MQAQKKGTKDPVAIKMIPIAPLKKNDMLSQVVNEVKIMSLLTSCPYIIKLIDHFEDENNLYLVMELANQGTLMDMLNKYGKLKERVAAKIMRDTILAIEFLHSKNIIHRDLKPENILIGTSGHAKLSDFGWSSKLSNNDDRRKTFCGTPDYISPEMIDGKDYDNSIDIWCLGVMLYEMLNGLPPFTPMGDMEPNSKEKKIYDNIKKMRMADINNSLSKEAQNLIKSMMHKNAHDRIKINQIKHHPWFSLQRISFDCENDSHTRAHDNSSRTGSALSQSNLITDSMMLDGEDPFDDFMNNRRLPDSGGNSVIHGNGRDSNVSEFMGDFEENLRGDSVHERLAAANSGGVSFRKMPRISDLQNSANIRPDALEIIPEEIRVDCI